MISATSTDLVNMWSHARNVRADFIQHVANDKKYTYESNLDSQGFIDQENMEKNYKNMYKLFNSNFNETVNFENISSIPKKVMENGALIFVFLNSNPNTYLRKKLLGLFDIILKEESFKSILMTNELIKKSSPVEKDITTNFFAKLVSFIGFQYNLPIFNYNPFGYTTFERSIEHVKGFYT